MLRRIFDSNLPNLTFLIETHAPGANSMDSEGSIHTIKVEECSVILGFTIYSLSQKIQITLFIKHINIITYEDQTPYGKYLQM